MGEQSGPAGPLAGRRVVVTGGGSGIGLAVARLAAGAGADVVICGRSAARLDGAAALIRAGGGPGAVETCPLNVADETAVRRAFGGIGPFDHLVHCAGEKAVGPAVEVDTGLAQGHMETKLWGALFAVRYGAPRMRQGGPAGGSITLISGLAAHKAIPGFALAGATDAAVEALARTLAVELAPLRVNAVSPGLIDTPAHDHLSPDERRAMYARAEANLPARRVGSPEDVAEAVLYLMQAGFVTGVVLPVDGGDRLV